ncbi:hypothetical protein ABK040_012241 [Willaertia magna]
MKNLKFLNVSKDAESENIYFRVYDWDKYTKDDELGFLTIKIDTDNFPIGKEIEKTYPLQCVKHGNITISIKIERSEINKSLLDEGIEIKGDLKKVNDFGFELFVPKGFYLTTLTDSLKDEKLGSKFAAYACVETGESLGINYVNIHGYDFYAIIPVLLKPILRTHEAISKKNGGKVTVYEENEKLYYVGSFAKGNYEKVTTSRWEYQVSKDNTQKCTMICFQPSLKEACVMVFHCSSAKGDSSSTKWGNSIIEDICKASSFEKDYKV